MFQKHCSKKLAAKPWPRVGPVKCRSVLLMLCLLFGCFAVRAQPIQPEVLYSFPNPPYQAGGPLVQMPDGSFYGTSSGGGIANEGTLFRVVTNGSLSTIASFLNPQSGGAVVTPAVDGSFYGVSGGGGLSAGTVFHLTTNGLVTTLFSFNYTNGANPIVLVPGNDGSYYGTTFNGGPDYNGRSGSGSGTIFKVTTNGILTTLVTFTNGAEPNSLTPAPDGSFYGTTVSGGSGGSGSLYKMTTDGTLTTLDSFYYTNGSGPVGLTLGADNNWYGSTRGGGSNSDGTVFRLSNDGTLTTLFTFNGTNGNQPETLTLAPDGSFYGTTYIGGISNAGTVFQVTTDGTCTVLLSFARTNGAFPSGLIFGNDGNLYGTTGEGGSANQGTVFEITTNGMLTTLESFASADSGFPAAGRLVRDASGNLYGATTTGGTNRAGTVFVLGTNGIFTNLVTFNNTNGEYLNGITQGPDGNFYGSSEVGGVGFVSQASGEGVFFKVTTNGKLTYDQLYQTTPNGTHPIAPPILGLDGNLYGTAGLDGANHGGTVFRLSTNLAISPIFSFTATNGVSPFGDEPGGLTFGSDGLLYGTTDGVGTNGSVAFRVTTNGVFSDLVVFNGTNGTGPSSLTEGNDGNFYGTTVLGGANGLGTVFQMTPNGTLTTLVAFGGTNGARPVGGLTLGNDGNFYGITQQGGTNNYGTIFQVTTNGVLTTLTTFVGTNGYAPTTGLTLGSDGNFYGSAEPVIFRLRRGAFIQSSGVTSNGFQINVLNVGGSGNVVLESSPDLMTWTPILTNGPAAQQQFLDSSASQPQKFYRAFQQ